MKRRAGIGALLLSLIVGLIGWTPAAAATGPILIGMAGPAEFDPGENLTYSGTATLLGVGVPMLDIEILVDGSRVGLTQTDSAGAYSATFALSDTSSHVVEAVAYRDLPLLESRSDAVTLTPRQYVLTVSVGGNAIGTVVSTPPGIACPPDCSESFVSTTSVSLAAAADPGATFMGWSGACTGTAGCSVVMSVATLVGATFDDVTPPSTPILSGTSPASPSNDNNPKIIGVSDPGTTVSLFANAACSGSPFATGTAAALASPGFTATVAKDTTTMFTAMAHDGVGNASGCSAAIAYVEDSTPPAAPVIVAVNPVSPANNTTPVVTGSAEAGSTVTLFKNACITPEVSVSAAVFASPGATMSVADDSTNFFRARAVDQAGNASACSSAVTYIEDSTPPTTISSVDAEGISTSQNRLTWPAASDAVTPPSSLVYQVCLGASGACANPGTAVWSSLPAGQTTYTDGGYTPETRRWYRVRAVDQAGNAGVPSSEVSAETWTTTGAVLDVAAGSFFSCMLRTNGSVRCWGQGHLGQLGNGTLGNRNLPMDVTGLSTVRRIEAGAHHACVVLVTSNVRCWGWNSIGQLGDTTTINRPSPVAVTGLTAVEDIAAGGNHTCALNEHGMVHCWGNNTFGELGDGTTASRATPNTVTGLTNVKDVAAGNEFTCALESNGIVYCWGRNDFGQLGTNFTGGPATTPGIAVQLPAEAIAIEAGGDTACAITASRDVYCWGVGTDGQLGNGANANSALPVKVSGLSNVRTITVGGAVCASTISTATSCWGKNNKGQASRGNTSPSNVPVTASIGSRDIAAGIEHTCFLTPGGFLACAGDNAAGQIGEGTFTGQRTQAFVTMGQEGPVLALSVSVGTAHSCAVVSNGTGRCWGRNAEGQIGDGSTAMRALPTTILNAQSMIAFSAGGDHTCSGWAFNPYCWGDNSSGQVGDGTVINRPSATSVSGLPVPFQIASGGDHTCAIVGSGAVSCWGENNDGQIGNNSTTDAHTPVTVSGVTGVVQIAAGLRHTCAVRGNGTVVCWGDNLYGQIGDGTNIDRLTPKLVTGITNAVQVTAGTSFSCALINDGTVSCWGRNDFGQLGNGTTTHSNLPVPVSLIGFGQTITAGGQHACVRQAGGDVWCWGSNGYGQVGDGTAGNQRTTPVKIPAIVDFGFGVSAGGDHTCAAMGTGEVWCWGLNATGQLGNGGVGSFRVTPGAVVDFA